VHVAAELEVVREALRMQTRIVEVVVSTQAAQGRFRRPIGQAWWSESDRQCVGSFLPAVADALLQRTT
jgi:hypothetical protein